MWSLPWTRPGRKAIRNYGGRDVDVGACPVLAREVRGLIRRLENANIEVRQTLGPALAALIALAYDPDRRARLPAGSTSLPTSRA